MMGENENKNGNNIVITGADIHVSRDERYGEIKTIILNDEMWFIGSNVTGLLAYSNSRDALAKHVDEDDKNTVVIRDGTPGNPKQVIINESGLYSLILSSKLKTAKEFKRWITHEVIPSIRKTGGYMVATPNMTDEEIMARAVMIGQKTIERISKENAVLKESKALLEAKVEADAPKVAFAEELEVSETCITIKQLSVLLYQNGYKTGEKRLFEELREDGFLCSKGEYKNEPTQYYLEMGLFKVKTSTFQYGSGGTGVGRKTLVTQKGVKYLLNYYLKKHGLLVETTTNNLLTVANDTQDAVMFSLVK